MVRTRFVCRKFDHTRSATTGSLMHALEHASEDSNSCADLPEMWSGCRHQRSSGAFPSWENPGADSQSARLFERHVAHTFECSLGCHSRLYGAIVDTRSIARPVRDGDKIRRVRKCVSPTRRDIARRDAGRGALDGFWKGARDGGCIASEMVLATDVVCFLGGFRCAFRLLAFSFARERPRPIMGEASYWCWEPGV